MAIIKNEKYNTYAFYKAKDVPIAELKIIITFFIDYSALNLGAKVDKADVDRIVEFVIDDFSYLPIQSIGTAFVRGSLGKLKNDRTTLNPRNIYDWLSEVAGLDYRTRIEHIERDARLKQNYISVDLKKYPLGQALNQKISWLKPHAFTADNWDSPGVITEDEYDMIDLKKLAEMIGSGKHPTPQDFGIEPKRK